MNILSLVMGLLLIFACTFSLSLHKAMLSQSVEKTVQAHLNVTRKLRNSYESLCYRQLRSGAKENKPKKIHSHREREKQQLNLGCARLNLWPLVVDGVEKHPALYETAAQILCTFYSKHLFPNEQRFEYYLLNALLEAARQANTDPNSSHLIFEKLSLNKTNVKQLYPLQSIYYRMLRGTKTSMQDQSYPSLLDYFALDNKNSRVCLHHASPEMLVGLFGSRAGPIIYTELKKNETPISLERLEDLCKQNGNPALSDEFLKFLDLDSVSHHSSGQKVLVKQDSDVCLKQKVFFPT